MLDEPKLEAMMASKLNTKQLRMREFGSGGVLDSLIQLANYCRVEVQNPDPETESGRRGTCELCRKDIPLERLEFQLDATICVSCFPRCP